MLKHFNDNEPLVAGCDEAGRGCLAGPVFAAAVILQHSFSHPWLNDSKQMKERHRYILRDVIEYKALAYAVAMSDNNEIDALNILNASFLAMHKAIDKLSVKPKLLLIDGNRFKPYKGIKHECVIKGDSIYMSIAAASVLAKTYRDEYMNDLHENYPQYNWQKNKAYPTREHKSAILLHGSTPYHRKTFRLFDEQLLLKLDD